MGDQRSTVVMGVVRSLWEDEWGSLLKGRDALRVLANSLGGGGVGRGWGVSSIGKGKR